MQYYHNRNDWLSLDSSLPTLFKPYLTSSPSIFREYPSISSAAKACTASRTALADSMLRTVRNPLCQKPEDMLPHLHWVAWGHVPKLCPWSFLNKYSTSRLGRFLSMFPELLLHFLACFSLYSLPFNPCVETDPVIQVTSMEQKTSTNLYTHLFMQAAFSIDSEGSGLTSSIVTAHQPQIAGHIFNINIQKICFRQLLNIF